MHFYHFHGSVEGSEIFSKFTTKKYVIYYLTFFDEKGCGEGLRVLLVLYPFNELDEGKVLLELPHPVVPQYRLLPVERALQYIVQ